MAHICLTYIDCNHSEKVHQVIYLSIQVQILGERCLCNCKLCSFKSVPGEKLKAHRESNESPKQRQGLTVFRTKVVIDKTVLQDSPFSSRIAGYQKTPMTNIKGFAGAAKWWSPPILKCNSILSFMSVKPEGQVLLSTTWRTALSPKVTSCNSTYGNCLLLTTEAMQAPTYISEAFKNKWSQKAQHIAQETVLVPVFGYTIYKDALIVSLLFEFGFIGFYAILTSFIT